MAYVDYVDDMLVDGFFACINCSMTYMLENTDSKCTSPLFEAKLELQVIYVNITVKVWRHERK